MVGLGANIICTSNKIIASSSLSNRAVVCSYFVRVSFPVKVLTLYESDHH